MLRPITAGATLGAFGIRHRPAAMPHAPAFRQIFWQTWRDLVFVHWEVDPAAIERLLPPELEPDLFEGKAYIALVPFLMTGIRSANSA